MRSPADVTPSCSPLGRWWWTPSRSPSQTGILVAENVLLTRWPRDGPTPLGLGRAGQLLHPAVECSSRWRSKAFECGHRFIVVAGAVSSLAATFCLVGVQIGRSCHVGPVTGRDWATRFNEASAALTSAIRARIGARSTATNTRCAAPRKLVHSAWESLVVPPSASRFVLGCART